jgi:DNA processing protein
LVTTAQSTIHRNQAFYPRRLRAIFDAPSELFVRSKRSEFVAPKLSVAIVGSRAASGHAMAAARSLAAELGERGAVIVSGGAIGIDSAAHRGAIEVGAETRVILANGLDAPYPARNKPLFADVLAAGGALVSAYPNGTPPKRYHFVHRNRLVAAMADIVIVACAQLGSGSLYTASAAMEYGRVLGALPGTPGCECLIAQGAAVVESADDVIAALEGNPRRPGVELPSVGTEERTVLDALDSREPVPETNLAAVTGLAPRTVSRALTGLELGGLALALPGRTFVRSALAAELKSPS